VQRLYPFLDGLAVFVVSFAPVSQRMTKNASLGIGTRNNICPDPLTTPNSITPTIN
jgi:hypothetical protein